MLDECPLEMMDTNQRSKFDHAISSGRQALLMKARGRTGPDLDWDMSDNLRTDDP